MPSAGYLDKLDKQHQHQHQQYHQKPAPNYNTYLPPSPPRSRSPSPYSPALHREDSSSSARYRGTVHNQQHHHHHHQPNGYPMATSTTQTGEVGDSGSGSVVHRKHSLPNGTLNHHPQHQQGYITSPNAQYGAYGGAGAGPEYNSANGCVNGYTPTTGSVIDNGASSSLPFQQLYNKASEAVKGVASSGSGKTLPSYLSAGSAGSPAGNQPARLHPSTSSAPSHSHQRRKSVAEALTPSISTVRFVSYCSLWYASSALSSNTGKSILNRFKYPVTLTFIQFGFVAGWCLIFVVGRTKIAEFKGRPGGGHSRSYSIASNPWGIQKPTKKALEGTVVMSVFQVAGHIFSSMAIARVPVSTVHTIKALSPLFTVLSYGLLFRVRYSTKTYLSLAPLTLGVMLACSFDLRANAVGFLCALGSTLVFVSQNIFSKKLLPKEGGSHGHSHGHGHGGMDAGGEKKLDKLHLLLYSSGLAFLLMVPLWLYYDGTKMLFGFSLRGGESSSHEIVRTASYTSLFFYFTINGSVHFLQNLLAFSILSLTSPVTYSIASLIKRIAVICLAILWFRQTVYPIQAVGITLTFAGLYMYNQAKESVNKGEKVRTRVERRGSILLPSSKEDLMNLSIGNGASSDEESRSSTPLPNGRVEGSKVGWAIVR